MSYELRIEFGSKVKRDDAVARLRKSPLVNHNSSMSLTLRDPQLKSKAPYDIGFSWDEDGCDLSADLLFKTDQIYQQLSAAFEAGSYRCIDDCDEVVTLEEVFRKD